MTTTIRKVRVNAAAAIGALVLAAVLVLLAVPLAQADHAADWSANGESSIVSETSVLLKGGNTSVETGNLGLNVDAGTVVTFNYELHDGAICGAGAPRVFVIVNGVATNSWDGNPAQCDNPVAFTIPNAGLITQAGIVFDQAGGYVEGSSVTVSNLTIGGEVVHFLNLEPEPQETEKPREKPEAPGVPPTKVTPRPVVTPAGESPAAVPTAVPAGVDTLPATGVNPAVLTGVALLLVAAGGGLVLQSRRPARGRFRA